MQKVSSVKKAGTQNTEKAYEINGSAAGYDTRHLTKTYIAALALVGVLVLVSYLVLQVAIYKQVSDTPVINLSGRQRMLSQKITKETLLLVTSTTSEMIENYHGLLESSLASWSRVHMGLQLGDKELRLPGDNSEEIRRLFAKMEPHYKIIENAVDKILSLESSDFEKISMNTDIVQDIVRASPLYLEWMDRTVFQYDKEAGVHVDALKRYETYILIILLMLLMLEAVFIFQPMVNRVRETYRGLQQAKVETEKHARQAEAANRAKSEFLTNMSHELRTPLHQIIGFSDLGIVRADTLSKEKQTSYFSNIKDAGYQMLRLVEDLMDLSSLDAGKMDFNMQENDLIEVVQAESMNVEKQFAERSLTLDVVEPQISTTAIFDAKRIRQVVNNLISNAIKFSQDGKIVTVSFGSESLPTSDGSPGSVPAISMTVRDGGVGIPEDELETIFNMFTQSSKTKTGAGGKGLGLAICKEIMTAHNGVITANNHPDSGAVLKVILPIKPLG